nr:hypothetical protein [Tanacetum cinerariifolium]
MSTQQDIYAAGSESRPPMLNKENYVPWSSRLLRYAKSRPNGKLIYNSILNGPYVRKMIPEPGDANRDITVTETFHLQTDNELSDKELKQIEADDQAIQTILLGLPKDIYAVEKKAKLFNELERFTSNEGNRLSLTIIPKWSRHVTIVHQTKDLHTADYTQLYDFLKYNQKENLRVQNVKNQNGLISVQGNGNQNQIGNGNLVAARAEGNAAGQNGNQIRCYNCRRVEEYDLMAAAADLDEIEEVNVNCILMANLQQALTSGTQTNSAPVSDTDGSAEVHENCDDNEIFNMFTQEEQYTKLLEPIPESHQVPQKDNDVISKDTSVEQGGETVEQHPANFEETRALYESLYQNLAIEVEKVNSVNHKLKETNADLSTELARFKNQERCFEISKEKYDKLKRCYQQSVYQEQCLSKKINAFHLSTADASLAKHKALELEIKRLLKAVVSQDIMIIVQNVSVVDTLDLQTELERTKECFENCIIKKKVIPEPGDANREITVTETFHLQTDDELSEKELKQIEVDDQAIQTILLGLPEDIYAAVDCCKTAQEIWLRVQQMMKGSDIGIQKKKAKLFNERERFTSNEGESIESYYHRFLKLMNNLKRNKHFPEKIASNLKFLNNLQPKWSRHVTIVHQTKDLHTADYT